MLFECFFRVGGCPLTEGSDVSVSLPFVRHLFLISPTHKMTPTVNFAGYFLSVSLPVRKKFFYVPNGVELTCKVFFFSLHQPKFKADFFPFHFLFVCLLTRVSIHARGRVEARRGNAEEELSQDFYRGKRSASAGDKVRLGETSASVFSHI